MAAPYIDQLRYVSVADKTTVNLRETPGGSPTTFSLTKCSDWLLRLAEGKPHPAFD